MSIFHDVVQCRAMSYASYNVSINVVMYMTLKIDVA